MPSPNGGGNPTVVKGKFTVLTGGVGFTKTLMFNPPEVDDSHPPIYGSIEVPGASHPVYQYGAGGERLITFNLYVDGDRGRIGGAGTRQGPQAGTLDISNEVLFYRALVAPSNYTQTFANVFPPLVIFTMGSFYNGVRCLVKKADPKFTYFTPKMEPVRAMISIILAEQVDTSVISSTLLAAGGWPTS